MATSDERRALFEAWYRDTYDGDSPDWSDPNVPFMYECWEGGHRAGKVAGMREALGECESASEATLDTSEGSVAQSCYGYAARKIRALAAKEEA